MTRKPASLPALVTVNVEPLSSARSSVPARARSASASISARSSSTLLRVAAADDRDDEALLGLHGDAEVVAVEVDDLVALEPRVQLGELVQRQRGRAQHGRQQQLQLDVRAVALLDERDRRDLVVRACQVLGDLAPHAAQLLAAAVGCRGAADGPAAAADVGLGDAPARPGRRDASRDRHRAPRRCAGRAASPGRGRSRPARRRRRRSCVRLRGSGLGRSVAADDDEHGADRHDLAVGDQDPRRRCPPAGDGISTVVLSVWISTSGWSSAISSPSATSQRATSPSVSPSPRSGSLNS